MCIQHILLASRPLREVRDDPDFPDLTVREISGHGELADAIRRIARAPFLYSIGPSELCGCYFTYADRAEHEAHLTGADGNSPLSGEDLRIAEWIWRQGHNSVNSFASYLERHADDRDLALYVCWERDEGKTLEQQRTVSPSFFGGPSFRRLPENAFFMISRQGANSAAGGADASEHIGAVYPLFQSTMPSCINETLEHIQENLERPHPFMNSPNSTAVAWHWLKRDSRE